MLPKGTASLLSSLTDRNTKPFFVFLILNRVKLKTIVENITQDLKLQNDSFLIYGNSAGDIRGFWFYDKALKDTFYELVKGYGKVRRNKSNPSSLAENAQKKKLEGVYV